MLDLQSAVEALIRLIFDATFLPFAVPLVVVLTALAKRLPWVRDHLSPGALALTFQAGCWLVWVLVSRAGVSQDAFVNGIEALTTVLSGVSMFVIGSAGTQALYVSMQNRSVPLLGSSRTPDTALEDRLALLDTTAQTAKYAPQSSARKGGKPSYVPPPQNDADKVMEVLNRRFGRQVDLPPTSPPNEQAPAPKPLK